MNEPTRDVDAEIKALEARIRKLNRLNALRRQVDTLEFQSMKNTCRESETVTLIAKTVCDRFGVGLDRIQSRRREESIAIPRMVIFHLARRLTGASSNAIGQLFGRDHGTVLHGAQSIANRMDTEPALKRTVEEILLACTNAIASHRDVLPSTTHTLSSTATADAAP